MVNYPEWVPESTFGKWFLNTKTWVERVIKIALDDLTPLMDKHDRHYPIILDVGVGFGKSLSQLDARFHPERIIGLDIDPEVIIHAQRETTQCLAKVEFLICNAAHIALPDQSIDMIFCHQTFHHLVDQESAIREFYRVLKPGGALLFAESTKKYIHSWIIRWLFRHPMAVQKTADEYLALIQVAGFCLTPNNISYPYLWWSRSDLGIVERWFRRPLPKHREETLINLVATKP